MPDDFLITIRPGEPYRPDNYPQALRRIINTINTNRTTAYEKEKAENPNTLPPDLVPLASFHDLRHNHVAVLIRAGWPPKLIQERLGHENISVTMDLYGYLMPGMQAEFVKNTLSGQIKV